MSIFFTKRKTFVNGWVGRGEFRFEKISKSENRTLALRFIAYNRTQVCTSSLCSVGCMSAPPKLRTERGTPQRLPIRVREPALSPADTFCFAALVP